MRPAPLPAPEKDGPLRLDAQGPRGTLLTKAPILVPLTEGELLLLYIMATTQLVSAAVVVEQQEEGHALKA
jgi:hypothetical protein